MRPKTTATGMAAIALILAVSTACTSSSSSSPPSGGAKSSAGSSSSSASLAGFPRSQTLYTSGTAYAPPSNWNPFNIGNMATGTQGLVYEPLFLYDPIKNTYDPWLASSGTWNGNTYTMQVRNGVKWSDGTTLSGADVAYSINLAMTNKNSPFNSNVSTVKSATASRNTVTVTFNGTPGYSDWQDYLWKAPVVPQHVWSKLAPSQLFLAANTHPVGTGPMLLDTFNSTEVAYKDNTNWWAVSQLGLSFKFKYLVDVVNGSNNVELSALSAGQIDWSNNFLPGINQLVSGLNGAGGYNISTFYKKAPYMISANTAWLEPNTTKAPMSNVNFRKALAYAINPQQIVQAVYGGIVQAASPTGLVPTLSSYVDSNVVRQFGFSYNPSLAKQYLAKSGYSGQAITLEVPDGWTDWMAAIQVITSDLNDVGIKCTPIYPQQTARNSDLTSGNYDLAIDNNASMDSTPWSYFQRVYNLPILAQQTAQLNWERFSSPKDWSLVQQAGSTALTDTAKLDSIYSQLESDFLQQLPEIPLWYNGAWFQGNNQYWTNYPANGTSNENTPVMWYGYLGAMTSVYGLAQLKPAPPVKS
ncbi:MAG: ABC transporter substrate-binding protein [Streptosporangiaceae bacterium]|nr:ABC transporter substrate-binding protein [Streptosporangiaceae bacterium]